MLGIALPVERKMRVGKTGYACRINGRNGGVDVLPVSNSRIVCKMLDNSRALFAFVQLAIVL